MQRFDIINRFIQSRKFRSFLEIGTFNGDTYNAVKCERKVSVDPDLTLKATYQVTSDEYFANCTESFDIIFIDGLHEHDQVWRDIVNGLKHLNQNGIIVMHDCKPVDEKMQEIPFRKHYGHSAWTGDCWKAFVKARATYPYRMYVIDEDMGCGVIDTTQQETKDTSGLPKEMSEMTWSDYVNNPGWFEYTDIEHVRW